VRLFVFGMLVLGDLVAAMFFLRFWHRTKDQLFQAFGLAFIILAVHQALLAYHTPGTEPAWVYFLRLFSFVLILAAIVGKNLIPRRRVS
jgi:uncharacterized membrane protein YqgA involved in biofilm formation